jgi:uncharacterized membrane protein YeaQ/YmgE (transglycosylase-associated protein family)
MGVIWTIVLGLVIGVIAKVLHPGKENMGFIITIVLGIAGSLVAGIVGEALGACRTWSPTRSLTKPPSEKQQVFGSS